MTAPPGARERRAPSTFRVAILTCSDFGRESAAAVAQVPGVVVAAIVRAPLPQPSTRKRLQRLWKRDGVAGVVGAIWRRIGVRGDSTHTDRPVPPIPDGIREYEVPALNGEACRSLLRDLALDLAILDGTNIIRPETFTIPRLGSINLHCGRLPDYRGAPPAFWELRAGEREVGVTVHEVSAELDAGAILAESQAPMDPAPAGDVMEYVRTFWLDTLRPLGLQLIVDVVKALAHGEATPRPQPHSTRPPNRIPSRRDVKAVQALVAARRRAAAT